MKDRVRHLLDTGLELYGFGKYKEAIECWKEVLKFDPSNEEAIDYLTSAGVSIEELPPPDKAKKKEKIITREKVLELFRSGNFAEAGTLGPLVRSDKFDVELYQVYLLSSLKLIDYYWSHPEFRSAKPVNKNGVKDSAELFLTTQEAFLLEYCDGSLTTEELKSVVQLNEMEITRALLRLKSLGLVEW